MIIKSKFNEAVVKSENIESGATARIFDLLSTRMVENERVVVMPNVCINETFVDGYTQTFSGKLLDPDILSSDLYCGLLAVKYKSPEKIDIELFKTRVKKEIPFGQEINKKVVINEKDFKKFLKNQLEKARSKWPELIKYERLREVDKFIDNTLKRLDIDKSVFWKSFGTIGGNDHFIKIGKDDLTSDLWLFINTGSRNFGYKVWKYWKKQIYKARTVKDEMKKEERKIKTKYKGDSEKIKEKIEELHKSGKHIKSPSRFLEIEDDISNYLQDLYFAKAYAEYNRMMIADKIKELLKFGKEQERFETLHNSLNLDNMIIRCNASESYTDQKLVIYTLTGKILICSGLGSEDWNCSAPSFIESLEDIDSIKETITVNKVIEPIMTLNNSE